jgi:tetratricopeptide (TPR) repeat protein
MTETNLPLPSASISDTMPVQPLSAGREAVYTNGHSTDNSNPLPPETILPPLLYAIRRNTLKDSYYLLLLFYAMGGSIPDSLFVRARSPQLRWTEDGREEDVTAQHRGLDPQLIDILSNEIRFNKVLNTLPSLTETDGSRSLDYQLQIELSQVLADEEKEKWHIKALQLVSFMFPRHVLWESCPTYATTVRSLLPLLNHALQGVRRTSMAECIREEVAESLLAAAKASGEIRESVLPTLTGLLDRDSPLHLQAELALQQSISSRLAANFEHSERVIQDFCCRCACHGQNCISSFFRQLRPDQASKRLNALYGLLHRSHLENLVQCEKYTLAITEVEDWICPDNPSTIEKYVLPSRTVTSCKIFRSRGMYSDARERLELCLRFLHAREPNRFQVLCSLADVYCDLHMPEQARELLTPAIEKERKKTTITKALRRLLISMVTAGIEQHLYDNAKKTVDELGGMFDRLPKLNISDELLHMRVLVSSARIHQCNSDSVQAIERWKAALAHVQKYKSFEGEGFTYAVIHLSLSLAYVTNGDRKEGLVSFDYAKAILCRSIRDNWIPTFSTWAKEISSKVQSMTGWVWEGNMPV